MTHTAAPKTHKVADLTWDIVAEWRRGAASDRRRREAARAAYDDGDGPGLGRIFRDRRRREDRRTDLADADLRRLSRLRRLCREREPVRCDLPIGREGDRRCAARLRRRTRADP